MPTRITRELVEGTALVAAPTTPGVHGYGAALVEVHAVDDVARLGWRFEAVLESLVSLDGRQTISLRLHRGPELVG